MSSHRLTYDELSQAISESYLHLSSDDTNEFTGSSMERRDISNEDGYDTSTLMRLARAIDEQQHRAVSNGVGLQTVQRQASPDGRTSTSRMKYGGRDERRASFISSHSTPLVSKQSRSKIKKPRTRASTLSDVEESYDQQVRPGGKRETDRDMAVGALQQMIESLTLEELEEFRKPIETLVINHHRDGNPQHHYKQNGGVYVTPKRLYINSLSSDSGSSGEDDDDRLSLTNTNTNGSYLYKKPSRGTHSKKFDDKQRAVRYLDYSDEEEISKQGASKIKEGPNKHINISSNVNKPYNRTKNELLASTEEVENELDSAITTPPHSQEYTNAKNDSYNPQTMNKSILTSDHSDIESSLNDASYIPRRTNNNRAKHAPGSTASASKQKNNDDKDEKYRLEIESLKKENLNLQIKLNELEIKLSENETNVIDNEDISSNDNSFIFNDIGKQDSNDRIDELTVANNQLNLQLANTKNHMMELNNEIRYLKNKLTNHDNEDFKSKTGPLETQIKLLQAQIGNSKNLITEESILSDYKQFYTKLQLNHVDRLTKIEMSNLIKNLMLSLLITDFEHLPMVSSKIGKFFKIISLFMDQLHSMVYDDSSTAIRPSYYLKNHEYGMNELQSCLDGMLETLLHPTQLSN